MRNLGILRLAVVLGVLIVLTAIAFGLVWYGGQPAVELDPYLLVR
jgi:hypothetical protein